MGYLFSARSGNSIYVEEFGSGPPVLALHGIGGGTYFFHGFAKRLASRYRVFSIDLPGTGNSSAIKPVTLESTVADIGDLVTDKIGEPVIILGHSFGTILALKAWETWPERIRALVFACGLPKIRPNVQERLSKRAADIAQNGIKGWGPKVSPGVFSASTLRDQPEMVGLFERLFEEQEPSTYLKSIEILLSADMTSVVPTIHVPCFAVGGAEDSYAPPEALKAFISLLPKPCQDEILAGSAHMPFLEAPEAFAGTVETFLDELSE